MSNVFVKDGEKYAGMYVAIKSFQDKDVIASGSDPVEVINSAKRKGASDPVVIYVPEKDKVYIY